MTKKHKIIALVLCCLPVAIVQGLSAWITKKAIHPWYDQLNKAFWNPPSWVFGPIWSFLYLLMAVSLWLVYCADHKSQLKPKAYALFTLQLILNGLWSFLFFGLKSPFLALLDLSALILALSATIFVFYKISKSAAASLIPYFIWIVYAHTLNFAIFRLNPS